MSGRIIADEPGHLRERRLRLGRGAGAASNSEVGPSTFGSPPRVTDGSPHLAGIGARWFEDQLWFVSGAGTRRVATSSGGPSVPLPPSLPDLDVTFRGRARRVTDQPTVDRLAAHWASTGWPARPADGAIEADYSAPSAGPPPWDLWVLDARSAVAVGARGAMRWQFV